MAEPGRCLVADAGVLESEVVLVSERAGSRWVYLDVGLFTGLVEAYDESISYRIEVHAGRRTAGRAGRRRGPGRPDLRQPGRPVRAAPLPAPAGPAARRSAAVPVRRRLHGDATRRWGSTGSRRCARCTGEPARRSRRTAPTFRSALRERDFRLLLAGHGVGTDRPAGADPGRRHRGAGSDVIEPVGVRHRRAGLRAVRDLLRLRGAAGRPLVPQRRADLVVRHPGRVRARARGRAARCTGRCRCWCWWPRSRRCWPRRPTRRWPPATPQCVPDEQLPAANALVTGVENATWIAGPGVLGLILLAGNGPLVATWLATVLFALAARPDRAGAPAAARPPGRRPTAPVTSCWPGSRRGRHRRHGCAGR